MIKFKTLLTIIISTVLMNPLNGQEFDPDQLEIGVIERLDEYLPLSAQFLNEAGDTVTLGELIDKPTILSLVYFDCPAGCSPMLTEIGNTISKIDLKLGVDYQLITISFNTTDTPEKARTKKENFVLNISGENRGHWYYLTGWQESIDQVTEAVGYRYKPQGFDFAHPNVIMMISPTGKITRYLYGLTYLPFDVKMAIIEAQSEQSRPAVNRILDFCFSYNPSSQTYTLQITRIVGAIIIFFAVLVFITLLIKGRRKTIKEQ